jgi:hypothetical protein
MRRSTVGVMGVLALAMLLSSCASAAQPSGGTTQTGYSGGEPNWRAAPTYGTIDLTAGFTPDPYLRSIAAGGANEVALGGSECSGYIHAAAPDLDLNYRNAGQYQLAIYAKSDTDITLVVYGPDRRWYCSDDVSGTDPAVVFDNPMSGNYNIWIGTYRATSTPLPESVLYISEMAPRW